MYLSCKRLKEFNQAFLNDCTKAWAHIVGDLYRDLGVKLGDHGQRPGPWRRKYQSITNKYILISYCTVQVIYLCIKRQLDGYSQEAGESSRCQDHP